MEDKNYLQEAFKAFDALNEEVFDITLADEFEKAKEFADNDKIVDDDTVIVYDDEVDTPEELADDYVGKIIVQCPVCQSLLYKDLDEIELDEESDLANVGEACVICQSEDGFTVIGEVQAVDKETLETADDMMGDKITDDEIIDDSIVCNCEDGECTCDVMEKETKLEALKAKIKARKLEEKESLKAKMARKAQRDPLDDIDADADDKKEKAEKKFMKAKDDADADRDYKLKKAGFKESLKEENENTSEELTMKQVLKKIVDKFGNNKYKYQAYGRRFDRDYSRGTFRKTFTAPNDWLALFYVLLDADAPTLQILDDNFNPEEIQDYLDEYPTVKDLLKCVLEDWLPTNHDSSDYVIDGLKNLTTGKVFFDEDEDYDDYDESLKRNKQAKRTFKESLKARKLMKEHLFHAKPGVYRNIEDGRDFIKIGADGRIVEVSSGEIINDGFCVSQGTTKYVVDYDEPNKLKVYSYDNTGISTAFPYVFKLDRKDLVNNKLKNMEESKKALKNERLFRNKKIKEAFEKVDIETDREKMSMTADETGKVTVTTEPKNVEETAEQVSEEEKVEVIKPLSDETEEKIIDQEQKDDDMVDIEFDELDDEEFNDLGESYLTRVYENVTGFKVLSGKIAGNTLKLEGMINFKSGKKAKTNFVFEAYTVTKSGKVKFLGENKQFAKGKKTFTLTGHVEGKKLCCESLNYNYIGKTAAGECRKLYGTVRR